MSEYEPEAGDQVLIRGKIADDGRTVVVAPGVELSVRSVRIETDLPPVEPGEEGKPAAFLLLVFATPEDRQDFADTFRGWEGVETRDIG